MKLILSTKYVYSAFHPKRVKEILDLKKFTAGNWKILENFRFIDGRMKYHCFRGVVAREYTHTDQCFWFVDIRQVKFDL